MCALLSIKPLKISTRSIDHIQHYAKSGWFSAPVWTENSVDIPFFDREGKVFDGRNGTKFFGKVGNLKDFFQNKEAFLIRRPS